MIRHNNTDAQIEFLSVVMPTAFQNDSPNELRKNPPALSAECHEVLPVVALKMRKPSTVEGLWHWS
jgi:hypothetical protein